MALINCFECDKQISDQAPACPHCGVPLKSTSDSKPKRGDRVPYSDQEVALMLSKKKKTSHVLHLLLSVVTAGLWVIIWILVGVSNASENARIDSNIKKGKKF